MLPGAGPQVVSGRAAVLIALIVRHAERLNAIPVGRLVAHFAHQQVKAEVTESLPPVRLDTE